MRLGIFAAILNMGVVVFALCPAVAEEPALDRAGIIKTFLNRDIALAAADYSAADKAYVNPVRSAAWAQIEEFEQLAQFQIPKPAGKAKEAPKAPPPRVLPFEYVWAMEMEIPYAQNVDLDNRLKDQSLLFAPTVFGSVTYRPANWLETRLEMTFEKLVTGIEQDPVKLPDGTLQPADRKPYSLLIDQLYVRLKPTGESVDFTFGRRNFEDPRLWLYDAALDGAIMNMKIGDLNIEASVSREDMMDLDLTAHVPLGNTNNFIVYSEYRGVEDHKFAGYWIFRDDRSGAEGKPHFLGLRAMGRPTNSFNYWADLGYVSGKDEDKKTLSGFGVDVGGTYRFLGAPLQPSITLGYAFGSGDKNPNNGTNAAYRQTGLQSNEGRFGGVTQFVRYGEVLSPELSNLNIFTAGVAFRPMASIFVDLVYHRYWLDEFATDLRSTNLTAQINEYGRSKEIGDELDVIVGFRNLFGVKGLGFETRAGVFFPGAAWRRSDGTKPDLGIKALGVIFF